MNKADVNNEIVLMRKTVRQAKVHIIRKLVREIRTLKDKKLPEDRIKKYKEKAEKLYEELTIIKKLDCDEVSKYTLTTVDRPQLLLSNPSISIREKALNRVAAHRTVNDKVKLIKEKYNISDNIEKILEPGKKKLRKLKHIEGKAKKKQMKLDIQIAETQRKEWLEQHNTIPNITTEQCSSNEIKHDQVSKLNSKLVTNSANKTESVQRSQEEEITVDQVVQIGADQEDENTTYQEDEIESDQEDVIESDQEEVIENHQENGFEKDHEVEVETDQEEIETDLENQVETDQEDEMDTYQQQERKTKPEQKTKKKHNLECDNLAIKTPAAVKTIDDFFITDVGTHYESTFIPKNTAQVHTHDDGLNRQQRRAQMFGKIPKKKDKIKNAKFSKSEQKWHDTTNKLPLHKKNITKENSDQPNVRKKVVKDIKEGNQQNTNVTLHPSWEAKKKLKPQITTFQGKKIVFDD